MSTIKISQLPVASTPIESGSLVPIVQNGVTKKANVAQIQQFVSVTSFGAKGDAVTNDRAAIQAAINAVQNAGGGVVYFPTGTYIIDGNGDDSDGIRITGSNITLTGEGGSSVLKQSNNSKFILVLNGTAQQLNNIEISNLTFNGPSVRSVYTSTLFPKQHWHLLFALNVKNLRICNNTFFAPTGDAILLGTGFVSEGAPPYSTVRHNENIWITQNFIDGFDYNNRNGISVVDGKNVHITNNILTRLSNQYMPGSIDIEPDPYPYYICQNIHVVGNDFSNTQGVLGHLGYYIVANSYNALTPPQNFFFEGNTFTGTGRAIAGINENNIALNLVVKSNVCKTSGQPFLFGNVGFACYLKYAVISENVFDNSQANQAPFLCGNQGGGAIVDTIEDVLFSKNVFIGKNDVAGVQAIGNVINTSFMGNDFNTAFDYAMNMNHTSTIAFVSFVGNIFRNIAGAGLSVNMFGASANADTCVWQGNTGNTGAALSRFAASQYIDFSTTDPSISGVGNYAKGAIVYNSEPASGSPKGWVCTVAGQPGTWVSQGNL